MIKFFKQFVLEFIPIGIMIGLIPVIKNDHDLLLVYVIIISIVFGLKYVKWDWLFFVFVLLMMTASESFFIFTGVEVFQRNSLFGLMPIWVPVLWAYSFVVMRRMVDLLNREVIFVSK